MPRLRLLTSGVSHGPLVTALLEGLPAGLRLDVTAIGSDLARRQHGYGRGGRMKIERDRVRLTGGLRGGETLGSPLAITIENLGHGVRENVMGPVEVDAEAAGKRRLPAPRPGHAVLPGGLKYGRRDLRDVLERASARAVARTAFEGAKATYRSEVWTRAHLDLVADRAVRLAGGPEVDDARALLATLQAEARRPGRLSRTR